MSFRTHLPSLMRLAAALPFRSMSESNPTARCNLEFGVDASSRALQVVIRKGKFEVARRPGHGNRRPGHQIAVRDTKSPSGTPNRRPGHQIAVRNQGPGRPGQAVDSDRPTSTISREAKMPIDETDFEKLKARQELRAAPARP